MPDRLLSDLEGGLEGVWTLLTRAAADPKSRLRWPVLSTQAVGGGGSARIIVLRGFDRQAVSCAMWTDRRSAKVHEINAEAEACLLFFDPGRKIQIRAFGSVSVETSGPKFDAALAQAKAGDMSDYAAIAGPGAGIEMPDIAREAGNAAENFARLVIIVDRLDVLELSREGHRRALFERGEAGFSGSWRVP